MEHIKHQAHMADCKNKVYFRFASLYMQLQWLLLYSVCSLNLKQSISSPLLSQVPTKRNHYSPVSFLSA